MGAGSIVGHRRPEDRSMQGNIASLYDTSSHYLHPHNVVSEELGPDQSPLPRIFSVPHNPEVPRTARLKLKLTQTHRLGLDLRVVSRSTTGGAAYGLRNDSTTVASVFSRSGDKTCSKLPSHHKPAQACGYPMNCRRRTVALGRCIDSLQSMQ